MTTTTNSAAITKEIIDGTAYYSTVRRGVEYCAYFMASAGSWFVSTRRQGMGRHAGGGKYFADVAECKAFAALPTLIELNAI